MTVGIAAGTEDSSEIKWRLAGLQNSDYCKDMIELTATNLAQHFTEFLAKVERGETIRIRDHGRRVARMVPDCDFMPGPQAAELFRGHRADGEAANAIAAELRKLDLESENVLDH